MNVTRLETDDVVTQLETFVMMLPNVAIWGAVTPTSPRSRIPPGKTSGTRKRPKLWANEARAISRSAPRGTALLMRTPRNRSAQKGMRSTQMGIAGEGYALKISDRGGPR
jgi:hypothetical protein